MEPPPTANRMRPTEAVERIVVVEPHSGAWMVRAAHLEPLWFRNAEDAERAGARVARTLAGLGLAARLDVLDEAGHAVRSTPWPAEAEILEMTPARRRLDS